MKKRKKKRPIFSPQSRTVRFEDGFGDYPMGYRGQPSVTDPRFFSWRRSTNIQLLIVI